MTDKLRDAAQQALDFILANGDHDQLCGVFALDDDGLHMPCTCGLEKTLSALRAALAQQDASAGLYHVAKARVEQPSEVRKLAHQFQCHPASRSIDEIERAGELLVEQEDTIHQLQTMLHTSDTLRAKLVQERDELKKQNKLYAGMLVYGSEVVFPRGDETTDEEALAAIDAKSAEINQAAMQEKQS